MSENTKNSTMKQLLELKKNKMTPNTSMQKNQKPNKGFGGPAVTRRSGRGR